MLFNSYEYLIFLPIVFFIYHFSKKRFRWFILLIASYYFYMSWRPEFVLLIFCSTIIDYIAGKQIYKATSKKIKKRWLSLSLALNLGLLLIFKYFYFFFESLRNIIPLNFHFRTDFSIVLPIGISFYTFQTLSYTIDIYRNQYKYENHFGKFALFVSFFPQLISGPIERANNLLNQIRQNPNIVMGDLIIGIRRILWGFFKKVIIADKLAIIINAIYNDPINQSGLSILFATYLFSFQIYCDFSGYTDIAIGTARLFGFKLTENFNKPYFATSIKDFWKKWHMTLTSWFRDYLYIPLGGNRVSQSRWYLNIILVFSISGLWHGAGINFIIWGMLHGIYYLTEEMTRNIRYRFIKNFNFLETSKIYTMVKIFITFNLVSIGWVFFRSSSFENALISFKLMTVDLLNIINLNNIHKLNFLEIVNVPILSNHELITYLILLIVFILLEVIRIEKFILSNDIDQVSLRSVVFTDIMIIALILFGEIGGSKFIYFQF